MDTTPAKVLVVDDDAATRVGLVELLAGAGYDARAVATFEEGIRILRTDAPDLLIADVRLGAYNGLQLLLSSPTPVPAIVITGYADPVLEADARRQGAEYVLKPVSPAMVLEMVRRRLDAVRASRFDTMRRFARKMIPGGLPAWIEERSARITEISYGGLRLELARDAETPLPASLSVRLPQSRMAVRADVVWQAPLGDEAWQCGAAVSQTNLADDREWRNLVDAVA